MVELQSLVEFSLYRTVQNCVVYHASCRSLSDGWAAMDVGVGHGHCCIGYGEKADDPSLRPAEQLIHTTITAWLAHRDVESLRCDAGLQPV